MAEAIGIASGIAGLLNLTIIVVISAIKTYRTLVAHPKAFRPASKSWRVSKLC
ncbi:hypothetical protein BDZ45DRAFT_679771 [Acephala macrosclerotiorum]|nr:hypothetical protein BDZ45DRAFT_679771 [Acephala macrosclerotiorum]